MAIIQQKDKKRWTKDGRGWYFHVYYTDLDGKRKEKMSKYYKTKKEAQEAERDFLNDCDNNIVSDNKNVTFEKVYLEWLDMKKSKVKITSFYGIKKNSNKHILDYFKNYKIKDINCNTIAKWQKQLSTKKFSVKYKNELVSRLKDIFLYAANFYKFDSKIANKLYTYRDDNPIKENEVKENFWTYEEFKQFISVVDNHLDYVLFNFLYYTGVRFGEMAALTWKDIDFDNKIIKIKKSLCTKIENMQYIVTKPKTENSIREIAIDNKLYELLIEHKKIEKEIYNFNENMFVFGNVKYIAPTTFRKHLEKYIKKSNVKSITTHGFRHSHVSLLIHLGCDSRDVANRIGDTTSIVESTYYHMFPTKKEDTINILNSFKETNN